MPWSRLRNGCLALGAEHDDVATVHLALGKTLQAQARLPEAAAEFERTLAIRKALLGPSNRGSNEARDLLMEPGAWKVLIRTLRNSKLEIVPSEFASPFFASTIKPEPIPITVKVILLGDAGLFHTLDAYDPDFGHLFKVLYSYHRLIRRIEDKEKVRLCSMILLERYVNPNVQGG